MYALYKKTLHLLHYNTSVKTQQNKIIALILCVLN